MLLFGSRARGTHRPDSDIDVILEDDAEYGWIDAGDLISNGGVVDAFMLSDPLCSIDSDRRLSTRGIGQVQPITRDELRALIDSLEGGQDVTR